MQPFNSEALADIGVQKEESLFRKMLEKLPAAAFTLDTDGLVTYFNPAAKKLLGRAPLLNNPSDKFLSSFKFYDPDGILIKHDQTWMAKSLLVEVDFNDHEIVIEQPDGPGIHVLANANPIHDEAGTLIGLVNILVDIIYAYIDPRIRY